MIYQFALKSSSTVWPDCVKKFRLYLAMFGGDLDWRSALNKLLTLVSVILTTFLMVEVVLEFVVVKPTSTSEEQTEFDSKVFPDVVVCVDPAINKNRSGEYGYHPTGFYRGASKEEKFIGWRGISGRNSSSDVLDDLLNLETKNGLLEPYGAYYKDKDGIVRKSSVQLKICSFLMAGVS